MPDYQHDTIVAKCDAARKAVSNVLPKTTPENPTKTALLAIIDAIETLHELVRANERTTKDIAGRESMRANGINPD